MIFCHILSILFFANPVFLLQDEGRPDFHPSSTPQLKFFHASGTRTIICKRFGNGAARNSEMTIFEIVDEGKTIRKLHQLKMLNPYGALIEAFDDTGRFVITMDEYTGAGISDRTLVIYDLVRNKQKNFALRDILSETQIKSLDSAVVVKGLKWNADFHVDSPQALFYPSSPTACKEFNLPFIEVDLLSMSVRKADIPVQWEQKECSPGLDLSRGEISILINPNEAEPNWNREYALPTEITISVHNDNEDIRNALLVHSGRFRSDPRTQDYILVEDKE